MHSVERSFEDRLQAPGHDVGVPARFEDTSLDGYEPRTPSTTKALAAARRLVAGDIQSLVLSGPTGVGKTHLAAGIVNAICTGERTGYNERRQVAEDAYHAGESVRFPTVPVFPMWLNVAAAIVELRSDMNYPIDDRDMTRRVGRAAERTALVVLDDLGREKASDWTSETIYNLVNTRYEAMLPTLVTTNLTGAELAASPYWPVISRLAEDGELVRIEGNDHRLAKPKGVTA